MDKDALQRLVVKGEGQQLEFKEKLPEPEKLLREAVAFANSDGGRLLVGVDDEGKVIGVTDPQEVIEVFAEVVQSLSDPLLEYRMEEIKVSRKRSVVSFFIHPAKKRPVVMRRKNGRGRGTAFIRVDHESVKASREMFFLMLGSQNAKDVKFEYGEKEQLLMRYLREYESINLREFAALAQVSPYRASKTLVLLVRANVLSIEPGVNEDRYYLADEKPDNSL